MDNFQEVVRQAFQNHGVENQDLEKAITEILNQTLDSRELASRIWEDVHEYIERDRKTREMFK